MGPGQGVRSGHWPSQVRDALPPRVLLLRSVQVGLQSALQVDTLREGDAESALVTLQGFIKGHWQLRWPSPRHRMACISQFFALK